MRQLSKEEKDLNKKSITRLANRNKALTDYYIPKTLLESNQGLKISYEKTKSEYQRALKEWNEEVLSNVKQMAILRDQIMHGVKPK